MADVKQRLKQCVFALMGDRINSFYMRIARAKPVKTALSMHKATAYIHDALL